MIVSPWSHAPILLVAIPCPREVAVKEESMVAQKERPSPAPTAAVALVEVAIMALGIRLRVDPMEEDGVD